LKVGALGEADLSRRLRERRLCFATGPFKVRLGSDVDSFSTTWQRSYASLDVLPEDEVCHFRIVVERQLGARRWYRPQVVFRIEGLTPFDPYPLDHAFPMFEWGLNWCIAMSAHDYLMLHSAVVERDGCAVVLPAQPGSGKSTLCAALVGRGWRLLSDEFGILRHADGCFLPLPRAAPLKNASIPLLRDFAPHLGFGPRYAKTRKGDVVHMFPPGDSLQRQADPARPRFIVFPRYEPGAALQLQEQPPEVAMTRLVNNSFNYRVSGALGFRSLCRLVRECASYQLINGDLSEAVAAVESLVQAREP
jgi:HprK-related kinase A